MPLLYGIRHAWPEQAGFCLNRRKGYPGYSFVHFLTSVEIVIGGVRTVTPNHACIIYAPGTPQYFIARQPLVHAGGTAGMPGPSAGYTSLPTSAGIDNGHCAGNGKRVFFPEIRKHPAYNAENDRIIYKAFPFPVG